jgi:HAE1 family hydrophobic/amphiphilic exporter-1
VFLPVVFASGRVGSFLAEFGLTVAGSVIVSLFVALTLTPMLAARMPPPAPRAPRSIYARLERWFAWLEDGYRRVLDWSLAHRCRTLAIAAASLVAAVVFGSQLGSEFFPESDSGMLFIEFETAPGSAIEASARIMEQNERHFMAQPETVTVLARVGGGNMMSIGAPNRGSMSVSLKPVDQRERSSNEIIQEAREVLGRVPGQKIMVRNMSGGGRKALEVQLLGNLALSELDRYADQLIAALVARGGYVDLDKSLKLGLPEIRVVPDREKAAALGVDAATLAEVVQVMIGGLDVGVFKEEGRRYDIRIRLDRADRDTPAAIEALSVRGRDGKVVELRNLVRLERGAAASEITRTDRQRSVTISANLDNKVLSDAIAEVRQLAAQMLPEQLTLRMAGMAENLEESSSQFGLMLTLAVLVIYMVLAAQFESFMQPLSVMLAVPFSMVGALGGLWLLGMTLNMFSLIGIVLLMGLVTKNSILLVDYANQLRAEGVDKLEAMRHAAPIRMRPVLMTALSMIFGVLPAAFGLGPGAETRAPMAVATAAGMTTSVLLTLLVVPVFYLVLDDLSAWLRALPARLRGAAARRAAGGVGQRARG